jgi:epoxyqueuosine reductase QueG
MSAMSNRYAAVCAGLGEFGWSGFVVTPQDGPRVRWVAIISELELEPDPLYQGDKLCHPETCKKCVEICPAAALSADEETPVEIDGIKMEYAQRNKIKCRCATAGLIKGTPGRMQADLPEELKDMAEWNAFSRKDSPWQRMEFSHANYCQRCMVVCPIGR